MPDMTSNQLMQDVRSVHDTASLQVRDYVVAGHPRWVVAIVIPGARSGSATIPGAYIDAATAKLVQPNNAEMVLVEEGTWKAISAGRGNFQTVGDSYSWANPLQEKRTPAPDDFYSPFSSGGTILFRPEPTKSGRDWFAAVRLIFADWGRYVEPAFVFTQGHPELAQPQLVTGENPLLAALAFRELVAAGRMPIEAARDFLIWAQGYRAGTFSYLMSSTGFEQEMLHTVQSTEDRSKLRLLALGVFAAGLFLRDTATTSRSRSILSRIRRRLTETGGGQDEYLFSIFEKAGIRG